MGWTEKQYEEHQNKQLELSTQGTGTGKDTKPKSVRGSRSGKENRPKNEGKGDVEPRYRVVVYAYKRRHSDPDNLNAKYWIDAMVSQGFLPDDSSKFIESFENRVVKIGPKEEERTEIEIWIRND